MSGAKSKGAYWLTGSSGARQTPWGLVVHDYEAAATQLLGHKGRLRRHTKDHKGHKVNFGRDLVLLHVRYILNFASSKYTGSGACLRRQRVRRRRAYNFVSFDDLKWQKVPYHEEAIYIFFVHFVVLSALCDLFSLPKADVYDTRRSDIGTIKPF